MSETSLRKGLTALLGMALATAFVGGMLVLVLNTGSGTEEVAAPLPTTATEDHQADNTSDIATPATTVVTQDDADGMREAASSEYYPYRGDQEAVPLPPMGIADAAFSWQTVQLARSQGSETWMNQLVAIDGTLWAVGGGYDMENDRQRSMVFTSTDGITWEPKELPAGLADAGQVMFTVTDSGVVAVVNDYDEESDRQRLRVFVSPDGDAWTESDLSALIGADESMWVSQVAGADGVLIMAGSIENVPDRSYQAPVVTIEHGGYIVELSEETWTYSVIDAASGVVVDQGSQEAIWSHSEEGLGIYDPVRNEMVITFDWEALQSTGVAAYESVQWGQPMIVEITSGDRTLSLNEFTGLLTVSDASGAVLFEGSEDDLWRGRPPTFSDPATGDVIVTIPWDVWESAHMATYPETFAEPYFSTPFLVRSVDGGATWASIDISSVVGGPGFYFQTLTGGPQGFLAFGTVEAVFDIEGLQPLEPQPPIVLSSPDGVAWTKLALNLKAGAWLSSITATPDGYLAILGDEEGSRVMASTDGATWREELSVDDLGLSLGNVWFDRVGVGGLGTFVTGMYDGWVEPESTVATISKAGRTLTIDGSNYTVTDDATGAVLHTYDEAEFYYAQEEEEARIGASDGGFKWGQGGIVMFNDDGTVVFAASHDEYEQAMSVVWEEQSIYYESEQVILYSDGGDWVRVPLPADIGRNVWFGGMVVTDASVALVATAETSSEQDFSVTNVALIGVPG